MLQFQLERLLFRNGHWLADDPLAAELADNRGVLGTKQLLDQGTFLLAVPGDAIDESLLCPVIQRNVTGHRPSAEDANLAHPLRADAAGGQIGHASVGEAQPGIAMSSDWLRTGMPTASTLLTGDFTKAKTTSRS